MTTIPSGTVTFLFTDIEGSTRLWEDSSEQMKPAFARQEAIFRQVMAAHGGYVYKMIGDAFQVAFETALSAVAAALETQRKLQSEDWGDAPIRVRMALHSGVAEERGDDYVGPVLNRVARVLSAGYGGQVLLTQAACELVVDSLPAGVELRDLGEHRLKDLARPERIYQLLAPGLPDDFPPIKTISAFLNNLPVQRTSFIGRQAEIDRIQQLLSSSQAGLVTLVGPGGTGKTRLALQAATGLSEKFPDGIWLVELASLMDPARVPAAVAQALGVREAPGKPVTVLLVGMLRSKHLLLILDNCEHLVEACASLAVELLRECPKLSILATSRELLGAPGELPLRVPPLAVPEPRQLPALDRLAGYDSVRLFTDRSAAASPGFALNAANAPAVAQICQRLDGIPLALELAAARTRLLSVEQIAAHLDDVFRLLTGGSRTVLPRQQTLRALIDWSYDLLSSEERVLLAQLSVFAGGWTLEAAEEVGQSAEVFDLLGKLVDKSLVFVVPGEAAETRYRMLGTIRQYAAEKLHAVGAEKEARDRHLVYFLHLAEQAEPWLRREEGVAWMDRLEEELDNLHQALEWSLVGGASVGELAAGRVEAGMRLASALMWFWFIRGHWIESTELLARLLAMQEGSQFARANALQTAGYLSLYNWRTNREASLGRLEESIAIFRQLGPAGQHELAVSLVLLGSMVEDPERGYAMIKEGLGTFRAEQDLFYTAEGLLRLGNMMRKKGKPEQSKAYFEESLALRRQIHDLDGMGYCLLSLGEISLSEGGFQQAAALLKESRECFRQAGNLARLASVYRVTSTLLLAQGEYTQAAQCARQALLTSQETEDHMESIQALNALGILAWAKGDFEQARSHSQEALTEARKLGFDSGEAFASYIRGRVELTRGETAWAAPLLKPRQADSDWSLDLTETTRLLDSLAVLASARGQMKRAATIFGANDAAFRLLAAQLAPIERSEHADRLQAARQALGEEVFASAWAEGQALAPDQAVTFALGNEDNAYRSLPPTIP